jgi:hypothetical protein
MTPKPKETIFHLSALLDGRVICGTVAFSPAPPPGVFAELAKFEAQRLLAQMVEEDIRSGRL